MVDEEKRNTIKRFGVGSLVLGGGGFGAWRLQEWYTNLDNELDPDTMEDEIETAMQGLNWPVDTVIVSGIEAELEHTGTTAKDGDIYTAAVTAPLRTDVDYSICDHTEGREELQLADTLREQAELLFNGLYDTAGWAAEPRRRPEEDRITEYTIAFEDDTGVAQAAISAEKADHIAQGKPEYNTWRTSRNRLMQAYGEAFDARCRSDGG